MARKRLMKPKQVKVSLRIPFIGQVEGTWEPADIERQAAWELYVELVTRVAVVQLQPEAKLREALSSLYSLFGITRDILKRHGPAVAMKSKGGISFGNLAVAILNGTIRPILTKWHPALESHEAALAPGSNPVVHEKNWDRAATMRAELEEARMSLVEFAELLGKVAEVESLLKPDLPVGRDDRN